MTQAEVATECEAFLTGRYADLLAATWRAIPAWGWVNVLAHSTRDELLDVASRARWKDEVEMGGTEDWQAATARLATDLLSLAPTDDVLREIQGWRLVPMELELAASGPANPLRPSLLVAIVRAVLARHPSANRHPHW